MKFGPVLLFTYNRLWHTKQTICSLKKNLFAGESLLKIYSDGPKNHADIAKVNDLRKYLHQVNGFKKVEIVERKDNLGLAGSIIAGVTESLAEFPKIIVLEDDLVTSPFFLKYMNDALDLYEKDDDVISIHAYSLPVKGKLPETFFLKGADCWGWATWRRAWQHFDADAKMLLNEVRRRALEKAFNINNSYDYTGMLELQTKGEIDSWAIRWNASAFLKGKFTLHPGISLVRNIGIDGTGTHCAKSSVFDSALADAPFRVSKIPIAENVYALKQIERYYKSRKTGFLMRLATKAKRLLTASRSQQ